MNRAWIFGVGLAILVGLAVIVLVDPVRGPLAPEARAMRQLEDASIRPTEVRFLRASAYDPQVICGQAVVSRQGGGSHQAYFVSTPRSVIIGRVENPALQAAQTRYCRGMFPNLAAPVP